MKNKYTDKQIKKKLRKIATHTQNEPLIIALTALNILLEKKIITVDEVEKYKNDALESLLKSWFNKYKTDPELKERLEGELLIESFFNL